MIAKTEIQDRIIYAEDMARTSLVPDEGPATYQDRAVHLANVDRRLAQVKGDRQLNEEFKDSFNGNEKEKTPKLRKIAAGLAAIVAAAALAGPGGMAKDTYIGVKTFPAHVAYLYDRYVGNDNPGNFSYPTVSG